MSVALGLARGPSAASLLCRRARRMLPVGLVLVLVAPAAWPLLTTPFIESDDGLIHVMRHVAFDALLRQGVFVPRLYPDFATGYGYPLGVFYPPLSLVVAAVGAFLLGKALTCRLAWRPSRPSRATGRRRSGRCASRAAPLRHRSQRGSVTTTGYGRWGRVSTRSEGSRRGRPSTSA